jgi:hypothetical protein
MVNGTVAQSSDDPIHERLYAMPGSGSSSRPFSSSGIEDLLLDLEAGLLEHAADDRRFGRAPTRTPVGIRPLHARAEVDLERPIVEPAPPRGQAGDDPLAPVVYGTVCGMRKTTIYVPDDLKQALERTAAARGCSEAELVREALRALTARATPPRPRLPLFRSGKPRLADRLDDALAGFGES